MSKWENFYKLNLSVEDYVINLYNHRILFNEIVIENPVKLLEVGIGSGSMSFFMDHLGYNITGVDYNSEIIRKAADLNEKYNGRAKFIKCNAFNLKKMGENDFDVVYSQGFFEHFSDEEIKKLISEQLKVGKTVIFSVPSNFYPFKDFGDERLLTLNEWNHILKDFNVKFVKYYENHFLGVKNTIKNFLKYPKRPLFIKPLFILVKIEKNI